MHGDPCLTGVAQHLDKLIKGYMIVCQ